MGVIYQFTDDYDQLLEKYKNDYESYDSYLSEITSKKVNLLEQNCVFFEAKRGIDFFEEEKMQELQKLKRIEKKYNLEFRNKKRKVILYRVKRSYQHSLGQNVSFLKKYDH